MQTYVVKFKSFKSVIRQCSLEIFSKINKRGGMFIPDSRLYVCKRKNPILHNAFRDSAVDYSQYEFAEQSYLLHPTFSHKLLFFLAEDVLQALLAG